MAVVWTPVPGPGFPLSDDRKPKMKQLSYGDGYLGRQPDGLNNDLQNPQLKWDSLSPAEAKALEGFIAPYAASGAPFLYTLPRYSDGSDVQKLYWIESWNLTRNDAGDWVMTAQLHQVVEAA